MPVPDKLIVKQLDMELNGGCNYKCPMCPQADGRERPFLKKLPIEVFEKVIDDAMQYGLDTVSLHGSGEPTLNRDMAKFVRLVKDKDLRCISFTNGLKLTEKLSRELIEAGIDVLRISCIGYDRESYAHWMSKDTFETVRANVKRFVELNQELSGHSEVHLYHLITELEDVEREVELYRRNWGAYTGAKSEIWLMHNWADSEIELHYNRETITRLPEQRRSCGRPFSPLLQVRAGGLDGHNAAVVACCMVLGKDSSAVLGHLDDSSIADVVAGRAYSELRDAHTRGRFDDISYCNGCDQLYDVPESLVWTDIDGREYGQSKIVADLDHRSYAQSA
ncbi:MAG: radical SAM protein [Gammaproteobacteria bacterium]|nr:radical SAM protein [Gammaproteobacteria bacterium]